MERLKKIYLLRNKLDGMEYIGQTKQDLKRRLWHGYNPDTPIQQAIDRDGLENFDKEILEEGLTQEEANEKEQYYIRTRNTLWPNGYNLQSGGKNGFKNHELTCQKLLGHPVSDETKQKISQKRLGIQFSDETKRKLSETHKGIPNLKNSKTIIQFTLDGQFVAQYPSQCEASRQTGIPQSNIGKVCLGKRKSAGGYIFQFSN